MDQIMVIGREYCETSQGSLVKGEMMRLPIAEALALANLDKVKLADHKDQYLPDVRQRYRRRDLRAEDES